MATMTNADYAALQDGYAESERTVRDGFRTRFNNPHPWGSRLWRLFEFGAYVQEKGLTMGARDYWQTGRGGTFTSPAGTTYRLWCDKHGMGIQRAA